MIEFLLAFTNQNKVHTRDACSLWVCRSPVVFTSSSIMQCHLSLVLYCCMLHQRHWTSSSDRTADTSQTCWTDSKRKESIYRKLLICTDCHFFLLVCHSGGWWAVMLCLILFCLNWKRGREKKMITHTTTLICDWRCYNILISSLGGGHYNGIQNSDVGSGLTESQTSYLSYQSDLQKVHATLNT